MIQSSDSIEGSGFPLTFAVHDGATRLAVMRGVPGHDVIRVEARAMGGHQKEAVLTEGADGLAWRIASDEGPGLGGSDLAPFPLGFFNVAEQLDLVGAVARLAAARGIRLDLLTSTCANHYVSEGSFVQGTGRGWGEAPHVGLAIQTSAPASAIVELVRDAVRVSPVLALISRTLANTFALYVNGKRTGVTSMPASEAADVVDPLKAYAGVPKPMGDAPAEPLIVKVAVAHPPEVPKPVPGTGRVDIHVNGQGTLANGHSLAQAETWLRMAPVSRFAMRADTSIEGGRAPTPIGLGLAGVAFCYLTQLLRYSEYRKYRVRAVRLVQLARVGLAAGATGLRAEASPLDTHLFVHAEEPDAVMQELLALGATRCYLHASLVAALTTQVELSVNGVTVPI